MSEREPELGLGVVASVDPAAKRIAVAFPATGERRLYALGTSVLKRVQFRAGDTITAHDGNPLTVDGVEDNAGLLTYRCGNRRVREDELSDATSVSSPPERLLAGQVDPGEVFDLRFRALQMQARIRASEVRGFLGGRIELIPHQFYVVQEVASRQIPRVLLADEVGLGKTIEACLIVQRLLLVGRATRVLILVPETLTHQWFVELLRRFNLWFTIFDEERCNALEQSEPTQNPFLSAQLGLASIGYLTEHVARRDQAVAAGWDMVVVDEAHHLGWTPSNPSPEYTMVEQLAARGPGLLLLTATPTQLGLVGHFARLRLLDPHRYHDFARFEAEAEQFGAVAQIADKIVGGSRLAPADHAQLTAIFNRDPARLARHLEAWQRGQPGAAEALLKTLLDQHGTGRVMFRNTRASMPDFPRRRFCPVPLVLKPVSTGGGESRDRETSPATRLTRIARELRAEETGEATGIRYAFRGDPRIDWLASLLQGQRGAKILLICRSQRKVLAIEAALQEKMSAKVGLFHEGLPLVQRDRNAAWFAEPEGAQLLLCSEIGSEGRNFQFAHHLVLFDLPLSPGLIEQRIGRLDRIGQTETIRIHVPYVVGSAEECTVEWYHRGLDAFENSLQAGHEYEEQFRARLLALAESYADDADAPAKLFALIADTQAFRAALVQKLHEGRDRLLELNSFNREVAERILARVRAADRDPALRAFLVELLDHFGVRIKEHEEGDVFLDPAHAYLESFPSIPVEGMLATFDRQRAIVREDIRFVSADHPLVEDAIGLLVESPAGTTAFGFGWAEKPGLWLEAIHVLETVAESRWHVDQFLAPSPVRVVIDVAGNEVTDDSAIGELSREFEDADIHRFLERPGFDASVLKGLVDAAAERAGLRSRSLIRAANQRAEVALKAEVERLRDLKKVNDSVRDEEIALATEQWARTQAAIEAARLRLDSIRLVLVGPDLSQAGSRHPTQRRAL